MKQKTKNTLKKNSVNSFGVAGYLFCLFQWFWAVMLYFSVIQSILSLVMPNASTQVKPVPAFAPELPDQVQWGILIAVTVFMIALTLYAVIKMPMYAIKASNQAVHKAAEAATPIVIRAQHKKDTKKRRIIMTPRLVVSIKALLVIVPAVLTAGTTLLERQPIDYPIAITIGLGLALLSIGSFTVQYILARPLRVKPSELW